MTTDDHRTAPSNPVPQGCGVLFLLVLVCWIPLGAVLAFGWRAVGIGGAAVGLLVLLVAIVAAGRAAGRP